MKSLHQAEHLEGLGLLVGLIVIMAALGSAFRFNAPLQDKRHGAQIRTVGAEIFAPATTLPAVDNPVTPSVPSSGGVFMEYQCPNNPAIRFSVGDLGWTRSGDPVIYATPTINGLTKQALLMLYATACV